MTVYVEDVVEALMRAGSAPARSKDQFGAGVAMSMNPGVCQ
jgi:hypothetical protein